LFGSCGVVWFQTPTWAGGDGIGGSGAEEVAREKGVVVARRRKTRTRQKGEACLMAPFLQNWLSACDVKDPCPPSPLCNVWYTRYSVKLEISKLRIATV
jgi:hypothetical protein